ncbi:hypothetical protein Emag_007552 [Eimeria magna]
MEFVLSSCASVEADMYDGTIIGRADGRTPAKEGAALAATVQAGASQPVAVADVEEGISLLQKMAHERKSRVSGLAAILILIGVTAVVFLISRCALLLSMPRPSHSGGLPEPVLRAFCMDANIAFESASEWEENSKNICLHMNCSLQPPLESSPSQTGEAGASEGPETPSGSEASSDEFEAKELSFPRPFYEFPLIDDPRGMKDVGMKLEEALLETMGNVEQGKPGAHADSRGSRGFLTVFLKILSFEGHRASSTTAEPTRVSLTRAVVSRSEGPVAGRLSFSLDASWAPPPEQPAEKPNAEVTSPLEKNRESPGSTDDPADKPTSSEEIFTPLQEEPAVSQPSSDEPAEEPLSNTVTSLPQNETHETTERINDSSEELAPNTEESPTLPASSSEPDEETGSNTEASVLAEAAPASPAQSNEPPIDESPAAKEMLPSLSKELPSSANNLEVAAESEQPEEVQNTAAPSDEQRTPEQTPVESAGPEPQPEKLPEAQVPAQVVEAPMDGEATGSEKSFEKKPSSISKEEEGDAEEEMLDYSFEGIPDQEVGHERRERHGGSPNKIALFAAL